MPEIIEAINIPTVGTGAKERVDVLAIHGFIEAHTGRAEAAFIALAGNKAQP